MKRWIGVIAGAVAGALVTGLCLYAIAQFWPALAELWAAPPATLVATTTHAARPSNTPAPAETAAPNSLPATPEASPFLKKLVRATPTPAASAVPGASRASDLPLTRLSLQSPYEAQGFDFQLTQLGDNRDHWVAASPDGLALVDIVGAEMVEQASVSVFGPIRANEPDAGKRAIYMLTMMNAILPGWPEGAEWFSGELVQASRQGGDYESEIIHKGVRVVFSVDVTLGAITLSFEPE